MPGAVLDGTTGNVPAPVSAALSMAHSVVVDGSGGSGPDGGVKPGRDRADGKGQHAIRHRAGRPCAPRCGLASARRN